MIQRFSCRNFRNVTADDIDFARVNILIGPNNSGKSNFLRALSFMSEMVRQPGNPNTGTAFFNALARNGWDHVRNKNVDESESIDLTWKIALDSVERPLEYMIKFTVGNDVKNRCIVREEMNNAETAPGYADRYNYFRCHYPQPGRMSFSTSTTTGTLNSRVQFDVNNQETLLFQYNDIMLSRTDLYSRENVLADTKKFLDSLRGYFAGFGLYSSAAIDTKKMRLSVDSKDKENVQSFTLKSNAENFCNVFNNCKANDPMWKINFQTRMADVIHDLQETDVVLQYDKLIFRLIYGGEAFDLSDVSEGTLKALVLNLLINMMPHGVCPLLALDEPEMNLHPAWQKVVGEWICSSRAFRQCFISTHSPDLLDAFTEGFRHSDIAVFVFGGTGEQTMRRIRYEDIHNELGDWELGDLYRTNDPALGGWPW